MWIGIAIGVIGTIAVEAAVIAWVVKYGEGWGD
jgi:hypothetical protein